MDKQRFKTDLVKLCISILEKQVNNAKSASQEMQQAANEYGGPKDRYDSYRTQILRKRNLFAEQFQRTQNELDILLKVNPDELKDVAEFGAIVITNQQKLFISVGLGKIELDGETIYAISPKVPIFNAIRDKKQGDSFEFNGKIV